MGTDGNGRPATRLLALGFSLVGISLAAGLFTGHAATLLVSWERAFGWKISQSAFSPHVGSQPQLQLVGRTAYRGPSGLGLYIEGRVKNLTTVKIEGVWVRTTLYAKDGSFIASQTNLLIEGALLPDRISPFRIVVRNDPQMGRFEMEFGLGKDKLEVLGG